MPISPRDLLTQAEQIVAARPDEASWRCAASRAYYAAMHTARIVLPSVPPIPGKEGTHSRVIRQASTYVATRGPGWELAATIAQQLRAMKTERTTCDYQLHEAWEQADWERMHRRAVNAMDLCNRLAAAMAPKLEAVRPITPQPANERKEVAQHKRPDVSG